MKLKTPNYEPNYKLKKIMNNVSIKIGRLASSQIQPSSSLIFQTLSTSSSGGRGRGYGCGGVRFIQAKATNNDTDASNKMADKSNSKIPTDKSHKDRNVMEEAFGEAYATRSDDEGFGGVYGGNDETNTDQKVIKADHDSSQGSHVEEKEKARNRKSAK